MPWSHAHHKAGFKGRLEIQGVTSNFGPQSQVSQVVLWIARFPSSSLLLTTLLKREKDTVHLCKDSGPQEALNLLKNEIHSKTYKSIYSLTLASFSSLFFPSVSLHRGHLATVCFWRERYSVVIPCLSIS